MNLTYLRYFYDAALNGSITVAARENNVSQSAVSQGIYKLEIDLQTELTTHQKQKFQLTEEGKIVFSEARSLFSSVAGIKDKLNALKGVIAGDVKFATTNALAQFYLPPAYLKMKELHPNARVKFHRGSLKYIHESLRNEKVDFALVLDSPEFECYTREKVAEGHFYLYKHEGLKKEAGILIDHLENDEVVELRERYHFRYGKDLEILDALSGWALVLTFVQLRHGMGYLPEFIVQNNLEIKKVKLDIAPIKYSICMIKLKGSALTRAESAFLSVLREMCSINDKK